MGSSLSSILLRSLLSLFHFLSLVHSFLLSLIPKPSPKPIHAVRRQVPRHLAIAFHADPELQSNLDVETTLISSVTRAVQWAQEVNGIDVISLHDERGILKTMSEALQDAIPLLRLVPAPQQKRYPMTPPPSDGESSSSSSVTDDSPPIAYTVGGMKVCIISRAQGKPSISRAAQRMAWQRGVGAGLNDVLEAEYESPELLIVHDLQPSKRGLELHGFPPWQLRLTEIFYDPEANGPLDEREFRGALDAYEGADFKIGK